MSTAQITSRNKKNLPRPNGERVTLKDLKSYLYDKDQLDKQRYAELEKQITGVRDDLRLHREEHVVGSRAETVEQEIKLDAKKVGIGGLIAAIVSAIIVMVRSQM